MRFDAVETLRHLLQVIAFCLAIATLQWAFAPERPYAPPVVYSLCIGIVSWAVIDLGRHLLSSAAQTGWPTGLQGVALVAGGIAGGFLLGNLLGDQFCRAYGWYQPGAIANPEAELRNSILITVIAGSAISYYFYSKARSTYLERQMAEVHRQANEARLKLLETQLEPHMLFNTLANLRALVASDPVRAQAMLDHMIAYLRATLAASRATTHALQAEFERVRDYLELMGMRMGPRLAFTLDLPAELVQQRVPTLLLQPIVENSLRHGLEPKVVGGQVHVSARSEEGQLVLEVADSGVGPSAGTTSETSAAAAAAGKGFGLTQVRERLATLYGSGASLEFGPRPEGGARTSLRLPLTMSAAGPPQGANSPSGGSEPHAVGERGRKA